MTTLWLVSGNLTITPYISVGHEQPVMRIVKAATREEAEAKFVAALEKIDPYGISIHVSVNEANPVIE